MPDGRRDIVSRVVRFNAVEPEGLRQGRAEIRGRTCIRRTRGRDENYANAGQVRTINACHLAQSPAGDSLGVAVCLAKKVGDTSEVEFDVVERARVLAGDGALAKNQQHVAVVISPRPRRQRWQQGQHGKAQLKYFLHIFKS